MNFIKNNITEYIKKTELIDWVIVIIILSGIIIRTKLLIINESFWYDTCALASNLNKSYLELIKPLDFIQVAPPVFMFISKLWLNIFHNGLTVVQKDLLLRIIPYVSSIISLPLFALLTEKMYKNRYFTAFSLALLCFNPFTIYYSAEFKPYSSDLLFAVILLLLFYTFNIKDVSLKKLCLISFITAISIWCSNTAFFIIIPGLLLLLIDIVKNKYFNLKKIGIYVIPLIISCICFYIFYYKPLYDEHITGLIKHWSNIEPSFFHITNFFSMFQDKLSNINGFKYPYNSLLFFILSIFMFIFLNKNYKNYILIFIPLIISIILSFMGIYPFEKRLVLFLLPSLFIIYSQFILYCQKKLFNNAKNFNLLLIVVLVIYSYFTAIEQGYKRIYITSNIRQGYEYLKSNNPELKNVISTDELYTYYGGKRSLFSEKFYLKKDFSLSVIPQFIETAPSDEYWIFIADSTPNYCEGLKQYLFNNKSIKILDVYFVENNTAVYHINKI